MSITVSPILDIILLLVTLYFGLRFLEKGYDLLAVGYFIIAITCVIGIFDLGGLERFHWLHSFLDSISRLVGTPTMGLGIISLILGFKNQKHLTYAITVTAPTITYIFFELYPSTVYFLYILSGCIFLIPLIIVAIILWKRKNIQGTLSAFFAVTLFAFVGSLLPSLPPIDYLKQVDILHLCIILGYTLTYYSIIAYEQPDKLGSR